MTLDNPRTPLDKILTPNNIRSRIDDLETAQTLPSAELETIAELSNDLGDMVAGRFIAPSSGATSTEPVSNEFSGAFMSGAGESFPDGVMKFGAVTNGVLNFGVAEDGSVTANNVQFNGSEIDARLTLDDFGNMTRQTGTEGSEVRTMQMGMESDGTNGEGYIKFFETGAAVTVPNGDFSTNDLTGWDEGTVGDWSASLGYAKTTSGASASPTLQNSARFAVTAGQEYTFSLRNGGTGAMNIKSDVIFYTAISGGSVVSTVTISFRSAGGGDLPWSEQTKNIIVPATATHAVFSIIVSLGFGSPTAYCDDFSVTLVTASTELTFKDTGLFYTPTGSTTELDLSSGMFLIADSDLSADAANFDFTSIPQTYKHLRLVLSLRSDRAAAANDTILMRYNNDSGSNYDYMITVDSSTATTRVQKLATTSTLLGYSTAATSVASDYNVIVLDIPNYASANINKDAAVIGTRRDSAVLFFHTQTVCHWRSTAAISRITILPGAGTNWKQYSRATLYGVM